MFRPAIRLASASLLLASLAWADNPNCAVGNYSKSIELKAKDVTNGPHASLPATIAFTDLDLRSVANSGSMGDTSGEPDMCIEIGTEDRSHDHIYWDATTGLVQFRVITGTGADAWQNDLLLRIFYDRATPASTEDEAGTYPTNWQLVIDSESANPQDASGNARNGTDSGTVVLNLAGSAEAGPVGNNLEYNSSGGSGSNFGPDAIFPTIDGDFTVFSVAYPFVNTSWHYMYENGLAGGVVGQDGWRLAFRSNGNVSFVPVQGALSRAVNCGGVTYSANQWQSIALKVYSGATKTDLYSCWNGATSSIDISYTELGGLTIASDEATIGRARGFVGGGARLRIDSVIVVNTPLADGYISDFVLVSLTPDTFWELNVPVAPPPSPTLFFLQGALQPETKSACTDLCRAVRIAAGLDPDAFDEAGVSSSVGDACNCLDIPAPDTRTVP